MAQSEEATYLKLPVQTCQHAAGFLEELHGFGCLGTVDFGKRGQPCGAARVASVQSGNRRIARLESPGVEKINPVDVGGGFGHRVSQQRG